MRIIHATRYASPKIEYNVEEMMGIDPEYNRAVQNQEKVGKGKVGEEKRRKKLERRKEHIFEAFDKFLEEGELKNEMEQLEDALNNSEYRQARETAREMDQKLPYEKLEKIKDHGVRRQIEHIFGDQDDIEILGPVKVGEK